MSRTALPIRRTLLWAMAPLLATLALLLSAGAFFVLVGDRVEIFGPSAEAQADIPPEYLTLYRAAAAEAGIDWAVLAAIGKVETNHGRSAAPGVHSGQNRHGCCAGPMQFFTDRAMAGGRTTWDAYGRDANGDGRIDVYDPADAIPAAARYLVANGAPKDYDRALFAYNHARWYVERVKAQAARYRDAHAEGREGLAAVDPALARLYVELTAAAPGEQYLMSGLRPGAVVKGTNRRSLHADGRAIDIGTRSGVALGTTGVIAPDLDAIALAARRRLGHPLVIAGATSNRFGEVIWRSWVGGNHFDHVHVGLFPAGVLAVGHA
jgi:hypothetical protein